MRILVTGAGGMLGDELVRTLAEQNEVVATDIRTLDVLDDRRVGTAVSDCEAVCHLAAMTDVDRCELEPELAHRVNAAGTETVARACRNAGVPMLYVSTIMVFDGTNPDPYTELDTPNPVNAYGRSKYEGELLIQQLLIDYYIVRTAWLFGGGSLDNKFIPRILELARHQSELKVVDDKFGSPSYTVDVSKAIALLLRTGRFGTYHCVGGGVPCSRFELAREALDLAGITSCRLVPVSSDQFPLPAPRPRMEGALNVALESIGIDSMRPWRESLGDYVTALSSSRRST